MKDDGAEERFLRAATAWQFKRPAAATALGREVEAYLASRDRSLRQCGALLDAWEQLVPVVLREHCQPVALERGRLIVEADPGPYLHELRTAAADLAAAIRAACPRVRLERIVPRPRKHEPRM